MLLGDLTRHIRRGEKYDSPTEHDGGNGVVFFVNHKTSDGRMLKMAGVVMAEHGNVPVLFKAKPCGPCVPEDVHQEAMAELELQIKDLKGALKAAKKPKDKTAPAKEKAPAKKATKKPAAKKE